MRHVLLFLVLVGFWVALSGQVDPRDPGQLYLLICGVAAAALATLLAKRIGFLEGESNAGRILLRLPLYLPWLFWQMVKSNLAVARVVWRPASLRDRRSDIVYTPYEFKSDLAITIFVNSITLTPGTVTVRLRTDTRQVIVCALTKSAAAGIQAIHERVKRLEGES